MPTAMRQATRACYLDLFVILLFLAKAGRPVGIHNSLRNSAG
jgi:hypothetical protein